MALGNAEKALKGVGELFLGQVATKVFTFLFLIAFVRLLNRDELAVIPLYFATAGASTLLFSFGIPATLVRQIPRLRVADPDKMYSLLFTSFVVVTAGIVASAYLITLFEDEIRTLIFSGIPDQVEFKLFAVAMVIGGWKTFLTYVLRSLQMFREMALFIASSDFLTKALGLTGFLLYGINGLLAGFLLGGLIVNSYATSKASGFLFSSRKWYPIPELLRNSWPFYFEGYLFYFRSQGDVLVISTLLGAPSLSVLYIAKRLYELLMTLIASIQQVIAPSLSQLLGDSVESVARGYKRMAILIPLVVIPLGMLVAGMNYWFIDVIGGSEYADEAWLPATLFCLVAILHSLVSVRIAAVFVLCRPVDRLKITFSQFAVYFPLLYLMVMQLGIAGAAAAQAVSYVAASIYAGRMLLPHLGERRISRMVWVVLASSVAGMAIVAGLQVWYYSALVVPVYLFLATLAVIVMTSFLLSDQDISQLEKILPSQLDRAFSFYVNTRKRIIG